MKILFHTRFGSHLYGTDTPDSDTDLKGIAIPFPYDIVMQRAFRSINTNTKEKGRIKNNSQDVDSEIFSLHHFIKLCAEGQTVALDMLFAPEDLWIEASNEWQYIVENRQYLLHKKATAFIGYCQHQAAKYGIKGSRVAAAREASNVLSEYVGKKIDSGAPLRLSHVWDEIVGRLSGIEHIEIITTQGMTGDRHLRDIPTLQVCNKKIQQGVTFRQAFDVVNRIVETYGERAKKAESNQGIDWKAMSHALRICYEAQELLRTGFITFPRPEAAYLKDIKTGKLNYREVADSLERELEIVKEAERNSSLPAKMDTSFWEAWVFRLYSDEIARSELNLNCGTIALSDNVKKVIITDIDKELK